jgi:hypothetical protein
MSIVRPWRHLRISAAAVISAVVALVALVPATPAAAAVTATSIAVSTPSTGKVAANTEKQVVVLTITGLAGATLTEENITGVDLGGDSNCADLPVYVVTSATTLTVKTPSGGCDPTSGNTPESVTIEFTGSQTLTKATTNLFFIAPPVLAGTAPVITDNSSALPAANQIKQFVAGGGQTIRVKADSTFAFSSTGALSASLGGKALTSVTIANSGNTGNYFTGRTAAGMSTSDPSLSITHNGVTKTFAAASIDNISIVNAPLITSLSVTSGKVDTATTTVITGQNLTGATAVTFCGVAGVIASNPAPTATTMTVTTPTAVSDVSPGLGSGVYAGSCPVKVTTPGGTNVHSPASNFTFVVE